MAKKIIVFTSLFLLAACVNPSYKNTFIISGTYLEVSSSNPQAAPICHQEFQRLDNFFNLYNETSELSRLNRTYNEPIKVSAELIEVLQISREVYGLSHGAFDVSHGRLYKFWKRLIQEGLPQGLPTRESIEKIMQAGGMNNIVVNSNNSTVTIKQKGLVIDLGAIAKGYMIDKAILKLKKAGIADALVNAGGDMRCLGSNNAKPWKVGIRDPRKKGKVFTTENLVNEAIATSGDYEQFFQYQGQSYSHLVDPRTGYPVQNDMVSVSVISQNCTTADSLATAFFIMGKENISRFLEKGSYSVRVFVATFTEDDI